MKKELLSEGLLALVVGVDYLVKLCRDGEHEERISFIGFSRPFVLF